MTSSGEGLLDTNTVILTPALDPAGLPQFPRISTVTLAELYVGPGATDNDAERLRRLGHIQMAEADYEPLPFDLEAARVFGSVANSMRSAGRKPAARTFDAMIAAVALANDLPLYTCNPADFEGIEGLTVVAVPQPG